MSPDDIETLNKREGNKTALTLINGTKYLPVCRRRSILDRILIHDLFEGFTDMRL
jgi:hypothetical protein